MTTISDFQFLEYGFKGFALIFSWDRYDGVTIFTNKNNPLKCSECSNPLGISFQGSIFLNEQLPKSDTNFSGPIVEPLRSRQIISIIIRNPDRSTRLSPTPRNTFIVNVVVFVQIIELILFIHLSHNTPHPHLRLRW